MPWFADSCLVVALNARVSVALLPLALLITAARRAHGSGLRYLRHADFPPPAAGFGGAQRIGVDDDHRRAIRRARPLQCGLEVGDGIGLLRERPERARMRDEVDMRRAARCLQAI